MKGFAGSPEAWQDYMVELGHEDGAVAGQLRWFCDQPATAFQK
jgi:hypothetical protein